MNKKNIIIQSIAEWLPQTQAWMYIQVKNVCEYVEQYVLCIKICNLDQFYVKNIESYQDSLSWIDRVGQKVLRKMCAIISRPICYPFLLQRARCIQPHVIHSHFGNQGWYDLPLVKSVGAKHVVTFYGYDVGWLPKIKTWRIRYKQLFDQADLFLCEGEHMASCLAELGCPSRKIKVHHLGVELEKYAFLPRFIQHGVPVRVLISGTFTEKKGIPYALLALAKIARDIEVQVTIIGDAVPNSAESQQEKNKILKIISENMLSDKVRMLGYQTHARLIQEAYSHHIFISPSVTAESGDTEGGAPVTIIEMLATGIPVVSTLHCDIPSVVRYIGDGWLAPERDVEVLVAILLKWISMDVVSVKDQLLCARRHIEKDYDAKKQAKSLSDIYSDVLKF